MSMTLTGVTTMISRITKLVVGVTLLVLFLLAPIVVYVYVTGTVGYERVLKLNGRTECAIKHVGAETDVDCYVVEDKEND